MDKRSIQQNKAMHKYFELCAKELDEAGFSVQAVIEKTMDVNWDKDLFKRLVWKRALKAKLDKESTSEMTQQDVEEVYEIVNRFMGENFGIHVPFPHNTE